MIGGVILAAGLSSRMKDFKPLLPIGNTTFIKRLILQMRTVGVEKIVVVTGHCHAKLTEHLKDENIITVYNENYKNSQMLESVKLGISYLADDVNKILLSPVDVVMSPLWIFNHIMKTEGDFIRPIYGGEPGHPVVLNQSVFETVLNYQGDRGLRGAIESSDFEIIDVEVDEPNILLDADTPEDYQKVLAEYNESLGEAGKSQLEIDMRILLGNHVCDQQFMEMLSLIDSTKSLSKAADSMGLSYTKLWKMLKDIESELSIPFVVRQAGGKTGGKSELTIEGQTFLKRYQQMKIELDEQAKLLFEKYFSDARF